MAKFNEERAANALVEALINGDQKAGNKFGVTVRSLQLWRKRLNTDARFSAVFAMKSRGLQDCWADDLTVPIRAAARLITEAAESADAVTRRNPEFIHAIAGALKICAEVKMVSRIINARTAPADRPQDGVPGSLPAETPATGYVS